MHRKWLFNFYSPSNLKFSMNSNIKWHPTQYTSPSTQKAKKCKKVPKTPKMIFWERAFWEKMPITPKN